MWLYPMEVIGKSVGLNHCESDCDGEGGRVFQQQAHGSWQTKLLPAESKYYSQPVALLNCRTKSEMQSEQGTQWDASPPNSGPQVQTFASLGSWYAHN